MSLRQVYNLLTEHINIDTDSDLWKYFDKFYNYNIKNNKETFKRSNFIVWIHLEKFVEENDLLIKETNKLKQENEKINFGQKLLLDILQENKTDYENNLVKLSNDNLKLEKELYHAKMKEIEYRDKINLLEKQLDSSNEVVIVRKNKKVIQTDLEYSKRIKRQKII
jgi:hypothetical protein